MAAVTILITDETLQFLEAELARATEHARTAKQDAKRARADAKEAKKDRKRARKALIEAQETYELQRRNAAEEGVAIPDEAPRNGARKSRLSTRIADSPERKRKRKVTRKRSKPNPHEVAETPEPSEIITAAVPNPTSPGDSEPQAD